jgi:hypothetical protein
VLTLLAQPVSAAIKDCNTHSSGGAAFTVYLDEPSYAEAVFSNDRQLQIYMDRLWFFLDQDRDRRWIEHSEASVDFTLCHGRKPSLDGSEFDDQLVDVLYNKGVILEIWGTLDARVDNGKLSDRQAQIGYLLVPLEFVARSNGAPDGKFFARYPKIPDNQAENFLEFFSETTELDAFIAVGLGVKALRTGNFSLAQGNLCRAKLMLEQQVQMGQIPGRRRARLEELADYCGAAASQAISNAQNEGSGTSALELLDPDRPCPSEGNP